MRVGVLTISDRVSQGVMEDLGGVAVARTLRDVFPDIEVVSETVPDDVEAISAGLVRWVDGQRLDAIVTTGGTGLGPRDVTPQATMAVLAERVPGIEEAIRAAGMRSTPMAMLSRGVCGYRGQTLIVNLPGSPKAAREGTEVLAGVLSHAVDVLQGRTSHDHPAVPES